MSVTPSRYYKIDPVKMIEAYKGGVTLAEIRATYGCSSMAIYKCLRRNNIPLNSNCKKVASYNRGARNHHLKKNYGITLDHYERMFSACGGRCQICNQTQTEKWLYVDHCHVTGNVRGLLCGKCNTGLGNFKDSYDIALSAVTYLRRAKEAGAA